MVEFLKSIRGRLQPFSLILGQRDKIVPRDPEDQLFNYDGTWSVYQRGSLKKIRANVSKIPKVYYQILDYIESTLVLHIGMSVAYTRQPIKNIEEYNNQIVWETDISKYLDQEINSSLSRSRQAK